MDTENLIREYEFREDIGNYNESELLAKYGESKDKAIYFMHMFTETFVKHTFYPAMIYDEYNKIKSVLNTLNEKYTKGTEIEKVYDEITKRIKMEENFAKTAEDRSDIYCQLFYARSLKLGTFDLNRSIRFKDLNRIFLEKTKKITEAYNDNPHFPNKLEYERLLKNAEKVGLTEDPMKEIEMITTYHDYFPLLDLCHDEDALIGINNLLNTYEFEEKEELTNVALNVIDFSLSFNPIGKDFDSKEYRKIAKATTKLIKEREKQNNKAKKLALKRNKASE